MDLKIKMKHNRVYEKEKDREKNSNGEYEIDHNYIRRKLKNKLNSKGWKLTDYDEMTGAYEFTIIGG